MPEKLIAESPWSNHLKISIRCWARNRARQIADKAPGDLAKKQEMEQFLTELLVDALLKFNDTYNKASNELIERLMRQAEERITLKPTPPFILEESQ